MSLTCRRLLGRKHCIGDVSCDCRELQQQCTHGIKFKRESAREREGGRESFFKGMKEDVFDSTVSRRLFAKIARHPTPKVHSNKRRKAVFPCSNGLLPQM